MSDAEAQANLAFGDFLVDRADERLLGPHGPVKLGHKAFDLLLTLLEHKGRLVTKDELFSTVWDGTFVSESSLTTAIRELRRALGDQSRTPRYIESVYGRGYRFVAEVAPAHSRPATTHSPATACAVAPPQAAGDTPLGALRKRAVALAVLLAPLVVTASASWRTVESQAPTEGASVAILPFEDLSPSGGNRYFAEGVAEEILGSLSGVPGIRVAARSSAAALGAGADFNEAKERLGVSHLLEGSVRREGERVRLAVRLLRTSDGMQVWSQSFDRPAEDIFAIQDEAAGTVAARLRATLGEQPVSLAGAGPLRLQASAPERRLAREPPKSLAAYESYLRGRYAWNRRNERSLREALAHFQQAIARDPTYAQAYAGLADTYLLLPVHSAIPTAEAYPRAKAAALRALELNPSLAEVHTTLGYVLFWYDWEYAAAERSFRRAIGLNPNYATAHHWLSELLLTVGRTDQALATSARAEELDPLAPQIRTDSAANLFYGRRYAEAAERLRRVLEFDPSFFVAHWYLGLAYIELGQHRTALAELERANQLSGGSDWSRAWLASAYAAAGDQRRVRSILKELTAKSGQRDVRPDVLAFAYLAAGDRERALDWLERGVEARSVFPFMMARHPQLDQLRGHPRFARMLRQMNMRGTPT